MAAVGFDFGLAATCCMNSTSGQPFDSCTCLADNSQTSGQTVSRGESAMYHWVLEDSNAELITTSQRGNLTFKVRHMLCGPVTPFRTRLPFSRQVFSKIGVGFSPRKVQRRLSIQVRYIHTYVWNSAHACAQTYTRASTDIHGRPYIGLVLRTVGIHVQLHGDMTVAPPEGQPKLLLPDLCSSIKRPLAYWVEPQTPPRGWSVAPEGEGQGYFSPGRLSWP